MTLAATFDAALAGIGEPAADGAATTVVKDQIAPGVLPPAFFAVTCQKYVVPFLSPDGAYTAEVRPVAAGAGGFVGPKLMS